MIPDAPDLHDPARVAIDARVLRPPAGIAMTPRLRSSILVDALVRHCNLAAISLYVLRRGDPDAGVVFVKLVRGADRVTVLQPSQDEDGSSIWKMPMGDAVVTDEAADDYLGRQAGYDPDLWIIEIDDPAGLWNPDFLSAGSTA